MDGDGMGYQPGFKSARSFLMWYLALSLAHVKERHYNTPLLPFPALPRISFPNKPRAAAFAHIATPTLDLRLPQLLYCLCQVVGMGIVLFKLKTMGLLPLSSADWTSLIPPRVASEYTSLGYQLF